MRDIVFRGKIRNGEWIEGDLLHYESGEMAILERFSKYGYEATEICKRTKVIPETVGQCVGLNDKNGKKIFEGDIVKDRGLLYGRVIYATPQDGYSGMSGFMVDDVNDGLQDYNGFWHMVEVIGNIHDNPELLEGGAE